MTDLTYEPRKEGEYIHVKGERILADDYPVHMGYAYIADSVPILSDISGNVASLKYDLRAEEIRNCNMAERGLI
jgi:hypothetical protein